MLWRFPWENYTKQTLTSAHTQALLENMERCNRYHKDRSWKWTNQHQSICPCQDVEIQPTQSTFLHKHPSTDFVSSFLQKSLFSLSLNSMFFHPQKSSNSCLPKTHSSYLFAKCTIPSTPIIALVWDRKCICFYLLCSYWLYCIFQKLLFQSQIPNTNFPFLFLLRLSLLTTYTLSQHFNKYSLNTGMSRYCSVSY